MRQREQSVKAVAYALWWAVENECHASDTQQGGASLFSNALEGSACGRDVRARVNSPA